MPYQFTQTGAEIQDILDLARNDIAAEYDPTASYAVGDYCTYGDSMYKCTASTTGTFAPAKWSAVTAGDEISTINTTLSRRTGTVTTLNNSITTTPPYQYRSGIGVVHFANKLTAGTYYDLWKVSPAPNVQQHAVVMVGTNTTIVSIVADGTIRFNNSFTISVDSWMIGQIIFML